MNIGENIKKYRKEKKITQKQLAALINKNVRTVQKYENGEIEPSLEVLIDVSNALNVPLNKIAERKKTETQNFIQKQILENGETLESLSEKTQLPLEDIQALYENKINNWTSTCREKIYKKFYNFFNCSDKLTLNIMMADYKINAIYNNDNTDPFLNDFRDIILGKPILDFNQFRTKVLGIDEIDIKKTIEHQKKLYNIETFESPKQLQLDIITDILKTFYNLFQSQNIELSLYTDEFNQYDNSIKLKLEDKKNGYVKIFNNSNEAENFFDGIKYAIQSSVDRLKFNDDNK